eukprot:TRINITY_DN93888_c0_g1_i1.p1 TRINITY_DN93888_c0_g1~~TRINITY_DN93888_c0_g1_i1.p1  ORF type:complete len:188 (-),score=18.58 TRINITY_DN93888_c0_g1_i1:514-1077(-)
MPSNMPAQLQSRNKKKKKKTFGSKTLGVAYVSWDGLKTPKTIVALSGYVPKGLQWLQECVGDEVTVAAIDPNKNSYVTDTPNFEDEKEPTQQQLTDLADRLRHKLSDARDSYKRDPNWLQTWLAARRVSANPQQGDKEQQHLGDLLRLKDEDWKSTLESLVAMVGPNQKQYFDAQERDLFQYFNINS